MLISSSFKMAQISFISDKILCDRKYRSHKREFVKENVCLYLFIGGLWRKFQNEVQ